MEVNVIEKAQRETCKCAKPCLANVPVAKFFTCRNYVRHLRSSKEERRWRATQVREYLRAKQETGHGSFHWDNHRLCPMAWAVLVGGPAYKQTVRATIRFYERATNLHQPSIPPAELDKLKEFCRHDSVQNERIDKFITFYIESLGCTDPVSGQVQLDYTTGDGCELTSQFLEVITVWVCISPSGTWAWAEYAVEESSMPDSVGVASRTAFIQRWTQKMHEHRVSIRNHVTLILILSP